LRHKVEKFILTITSSKYHQSTESNVFSKLTLSNNNSFVKLRVSSTISLAIRIPSIIFLPLIKAEWDSEITLPTTLLKLFARTFSKILFKQPINELGQKSAMCQRLSTLEIKVMKVLLIPLVNLSWRWNSKNRSNSSF